MVGLTPHYIYVMNFGLPESVRHKIKFSFRFIITNRNGSFYIVQACIIISECRFYFLFHFFSVFEPKRTVS